MDHVFRCAVDIGMYFLLVNLPNIFTVAHMDVGLLEFGTLGPTVGMDIHPSKLTWKWRWAPFKTTILDKAF